MKKSGGKSQSNFPLSDWRRTGEKAARAFLCGRRRSPTLSAYPRLRAQGISLAEAAATLLMSENSARVLEFRTRRWLREELSREGLL